MRIKVKNDTEVQKRRRINTEVKKEAIEIKKEGTLTDADDLFDPLQSLVLEYLGDKNHLNDKVNLNDENSSIPRISIPRRIGALSVRIKWPYTMGDKNSLSDDMDLSGDVKDHLADDKKQTDILKSLSHPNNYKFQSRLTLLGNLTISYSTLIAHNLLWHIDVDETLEFAASNPAALLIPVEIKDPHGQRVKGTPLQILAAAGDRNPRELKPGEKDYGLVERLRSCFPKDSKDYDKQLEEWFRQDSKKEQTNKTMAPYVNAINTLCQEIIASTEIPDEVKSDGEFEALLKLPIVEKFRKALTPDPNHVVTSGFLFDLQIFLDFFEIWVVNVNNDKVKDKSRPNLGGFSNVKSDLFAAIVYPALQARAQRIDLEVFTTGIGNVVDKGQFPIPMNFSKGVPANFLGLGISFFFGYGHPPRGPESRLCVWMRQGAKLRIDRFCSVAPRWAASLLLFETYVKQKQWTMESRVNLKLTSS